MLFAHHADFGFSRPTDKFCPLNSVLRHACYRGRSTDKFNRESCKMGAARARISGEQCGTPRPSVGPHSGSYGEAAQQSSPCCARIQHRIEQNRTFHRRYLVGSSRYRYRELAAQDAALPAQHTALSASCAALCEMSVGEMILAGKAKVGTTVELLWREDLSTPFSQQIIFGNLTPY